MTVVAAVAALLAAALHVFIWTLESVSWRRPATWKRFGVSSQADADTTASMAYNQGFYNLFLAVVAVVGVVLLGVGRDDAGWALVLAATGSMLAAALVLVTTGRRYLRAALTQGTIPAVTIVCSVVALLA